MPSSPAYTLVQLRQSILIGTFVFVELALWLNAYESDVLKTPLFVLGASFLVALALASAMLAGKVDLPRGNIFLLVLLHVPLFLISFWWTYDPSYSWSAIFFGLSSVIMFFAGATTLSTRGTLKHSLHAIEWVTAVLCCVGLVQLAFGDDLPIVFFVEQTRRIPSLSGNSIFFSSYLALMFPVVASQTFAEREWRFRTFARCLLLGLMAMLLVSTQTRTSMIAWCGSLILFAFLGYRSLKKSTAILAAVALTALVVAYAMIVQPTVVGRFTQAFGQTSRSTIARRMVFWKTGWNAFRASPLIGHGIGSFEKTVFEYRAPDYWKTGSEDIIPHAHNEMLEIGVEFGLLGIVLCAWTVFLILRRGIHLVRTTSGWERWTAVGLVCGIVAIAIDNLGNVSLRAASSALPTWLLMGVLWSNALANDVSARRIIFFPAKKVMLAIPVAFWLLFVFLYGRAQILHVEAEVRVADALLRASANPATRVADLREAVAQDPLNLFARSRLTQELLEQNRWQEALRSSDELQTLSPLYPQSSLMKAYALIRLGRALECLDCIGEELRRRSHPVAFEIEAEACRELRDTSGERNAVGAFLREIMQMKAAPPFRNYCLRLAELSHEAPHRERAAALFDSLATAFPDARDFLAKVKDHLTGQ